jgi:pectate lyase
MKNFVFVTILLNLAQISGAADFIPAFPGAQGWGAHCSGGRGGRIVKVTNLNDSGPGTLREACSIKGKRIIIFTISGVIRVFNPIEIIHPDITIAGETAPGHGITIFGQNGRGGLHTVYTDSKSNSQVYNVIIRFIRVRLADNCDQGDALRLYNVNNAIVDHCSFGWASDETADLSRSSNISLQWSIFNESLGAREGHNLGVFHCYGNSQKFSFHHNLLTHHNYRYPVVNSDKVDIRNNIMYNWRDGCTGFDNLDEKWHEIPFPHSINIIGNYYKKGPNSSINHKSHLPVQISDKYKYFIHGNFYQSFGFSTDDQVKMISASPTRINLGAPIFGTPPTNTHTAQEAFKIVLQEAGCLPHDNLDLRNISETFSGTGNWCINPDTTFLKNTSPTPDLKRRDTDNDGMPDFWEKSVGTSPNLSDENRDSDRDGYTNIEEYLHFCAKQKIFIGKSSLTVTK